MMPLLPYIVILVLIYRVCCHAEFLVAIVTPHDVMPTTAAAALSVELWWRIPDWDNWNSLSTANGRNDSVECADLALGITNEHTPPVAWVAFRTADALFDACRTIYFMTDAEDEELMPIQPHQLVHFVATLQDQEQVFYWNGRRIATTYESWNGTSSDYNQYLFYNIQLMGQSLDINSNGTFMGSDAAPMLSTMSSPVLYRFTMYEAALDDTAVLERIQQGLPSTPAMALSQTIALYEDAESVPESHAPEWYRTPTPVSQAAALPGPRITCLDCDVQRLQTMLFPNVSFPALPTIYVYVTELPAVGQLYLRVDKKEILLSTLPGKATFIPLPPLQQDPWTIRSLVYIPPHNRAAFLTRIRYCLSKAPIWNAAQCNSTATVDVRVEAVNDPPVAMPVAPVTLTEGINASVKIPLDGTDVDNGDGIATVQIVTPPTWGTLQLVVSSFRENDFLPHGTLLSHINNTISVFQAPVYVQYVWRRPSHPVLISSPGGIPDFFTFRVQDHQGVWSGVQRVEVPVVSALSANSALPPVLHAEESIPLLWRGSDATGESRRYGFHVERIPSPDVGWLWHPATHQSIRQNGTTVATNASMSLEILFYAAANVCQRFNTTTTEILIRFVAYGSTSNHADDAVVESVSDAVVQTIVIDCANDLLSLTVPNQTMTVRQFTLADVTDPCAAVPWSNASSLSSFDCPIVLHGIQVSSGSMKDRQVLVTLTTQFGFLTLFCPDYFWNQTHPVLGRPVLAAGTLSFSATATDAALILSALHYQSYVVGWDRIDVELQDLHCSLPSEKSCPIPLRGSVGVEVVAASKVTTRGSLWRGPWNVLICLFVYPLVYWGIVWLDMKRFPIQDSDDADTVGSQVLEPTDLRFREHEDADGMLYYEDTWNGTTRWDLPEGEDCLHRDEVNGACL